VNGYNAGLLTNNPNFLNQGNGAGAANPLRLDLTDQDNANTAEQMVTTSGLWTLPRSPWE